MATAVLPVPVLPYIVTSGGVTLLKASIQYFATDFICSSRSVSYTHLVENITPESKWAAKIVSDDKIEKLIVNKADINETKIKLSTTEEKPDLICVGCPHASLEEIKRVSETVAGLKLENMLWVCTSISVKAAADRMGYTEIIENAGGKMVCDTCLLYTSEIEGRGRYKSNLES